MLNASHTAILRGDKADAFVVDEGSSIPQSNFKILGTVFVPGPGFFSGNLILPTLDRWHRQKVLAKEFLFDGYEARQLLFDFPDPELSTTLRESPEDEICETWLWLMRIGAARPHMMAAKRTAFVRAHWSEAKLIERAEARGLSAHDVMDFLKVKATNRAQRRKKK